MMISLRAFTRSVPQVAARCCKTPVLRSSATAVRPASFAQSVFLPSRTQCASAFSTSTVRRAKSAPANSESDAELFKKISHEIELEEEMKEQDDVPTSVKDYLDNCPFKLVDTPGREEIVMTRIFGDEKIHITFSIADLNSMDPEYDDPAMADEADESSPEQTEASAIDEDSPENEEDEESNGPYPTRINVIIEKPNKGALSIETVASEGAIVIENLFYYSDASHAYGKTPEKIHQRQELYVGPQFGNLDEDLQVLMERYLDERGVNQALAIFVPAYIDVKEQREYLRWLNNLRAFVG